MDPLGAVGLAFSIYKDVYFLAKSVYKLATSAHNYTEEKLALLRDFFRQFLYLRTFHHIFFVVRRRILVDDGGLNASLLAEVRIIVQELGRALSDYKEIVMQQDADYRRYCTTPQQLNHTLLDEFPADLDDISAPAQLESRNHHENQKHLDSRNQHGCERRKSRAWFLSYRGLKTHFAKEPIYSWEPWRWALFGRKRLEQVVTDFRHCNEQLKTFEPLLLASTLLTRQDLADLVVAIQSEPHSVASAFIPHIRMREVAENTGNHIAPTPPLAIIAPGPSKGSPLSLTPRPSSRTIVEYKYYSTASDFAQHEGVDGQISSDRGDGITAKRHGPIAQVHQLARLLSEAGALDFHTLPFKGYMNNPDDSCFAFYFHYPKDASDKEPVTLNSLIADPDVYERLPLPARFHIALTIAKALGAFHADGWVHKSVSSDSIKFFYDIQGPCVYQKPYLTDFEFSRPETGETVNTFDEDPEKNLYRHPDRQGPPSVQFNKVHDVYALGVVLLEIGVWQTAMSVYNTHCDLLAGRGLITVLKPKELQAVLFDDAKNRVAHTMGPAYAEAVATCLSAELMTVVDKDEFGIMFRKKVIEKIDPRQILGDPLAV